MSVIHHDIVSQHIISKVCGLIYQSNFDI